MHTDSTLHSSFADAPPAWVTDSLGQHQVTRSAASGSPLSMQVARGADFTVLTAVVSEAVELPEDALLQQVCDAYQAILSTIEGLGQHAVRFWNYIPDLHASMPSGLDRYMVFNSGRFLAYSQRVRDIQAFARTLPTSSGVGSFSSALSIHCFAGPAVGRPIEHARQIPAYEYSFRYGPHPPCFARATLVAAPGDPRPRLLVGGTASVRGEDSMHADRFGAQVDETLANLASIVTTANAVSRNENTAPPAQTASDALSLFTDLRVYLPPPADGARVLDLLAPKFPGVGRVEIVKADLCRRELLVEIEGVATLGGQ